MTPSLPLYKSRKFQVLMLDTVVSVALYFGAKYVGPSAFDDIKYLIGILQPVALLVIYSITSEDNAKAKNVAQLEMVKVQTAADVHVAQTEKATARIEATGNSNLG